MKTKRHFLSLLLVLFMASGPLMAQDVFFQDANAETEAQAKTLTEKYQPELVMTSDQTLRFEQRLIEFLIRRNKIREMDLSAADKLHMLTQLSNQETNEMGSILTRPQLRRYQRVKPEIQPLQVVVKK